MKILQINLDRVRAAQDLVFRTALEIAADLIIACEPNKLMSRNRGWYMDNRTDVCIINRSKDIKVDKWGKGDGFVFVRTGNLWIYGCYISPNVSLRAFEEFLEGIAADIRDKGDKILLAGDFNAKSPMWGSVTEDRRGAMLAEWAAVNNIIFTNQGSKPTFERGNSSSFIDITMCTESINSHIREWEVSDRESMSWHNYIIFRVERLVKRERGPRRGRGQLDVNALSSCIRSEDPFREANDINTATNVLQRLCSRFTPHTRVDEKGNTVYWWSLELAEIKKNLCAARRNLNRERRRTHGGGDSIRALVDRHTELKNTFRKAIKRQKSQCWKKLQADLQRDIWGEAYKIVTNALNIRIPKEYMSALRKIEIAQQLFPPKPEMDWECLYMPPEEEIPLVTATEIVTAADRLKNRTAPGIDEIPTEAVKSWAKEAPESLRHLINRYFGSGLFPDEWKEARLVLIPKPGRDPDTASGYRPICLLNTLAKLYEAIILARLEEQILTSGDLNPQQYGFRKGRSTTGAIQRVMDIATQAKAEKNLCALILIDIRNAFNTASWSKIMEKLAQRRLNPCVIRLVGNYLKNRHVQVSKEQTIKVTGGVPQGSVLGPCLWNVLYDDVLGLDVPRGSTLVAYADDLAAVVVGKNEKALMENGNEIMRKILEWTEVNELEIAPEKTEAVLLVGLKRPKNVTFRLGDTIIEPSKMVKYLGVTIDKCLTFGPHVTKVCEKTERTVSALLRLMPNIGGASQNKRRILAEAANAILVYAAPVWARALNVKRNRKKLRNTQRKLAIRVSSLYRTTSTEAAQVISSVIPIDELLRERVEITHRAGPLDERQRTARTETLRRWQISWDGDTNGRWTHTLIGDLNSWYGRKFGEINYFSSQFLSGHGSFMSFLKRIRKTESDACIYCGEQDTPHHTVFECNRWFVIRENMETNLGRRLAPENIIRIALESKSNWNTVFRGLESIMEQKAMEMRRRME